jgi:hypothetical protein
LRSLLTIHCVLLRECPDNGAVERALILDYPVDLTIPGGERSP